MFGILLFLIGVKQYFCIFDCITLIMKEIWHCFMLSGLFIGFLNFFFGTGA
jgi:hypothetical protein